MGIAGIYEYDKYQMINPGHSASEQNSQGTELMIGKLKRYANKKGTGKHNMIDRSVEHVDMTGTCAVYNGQVNFRKIIAEILRKEIPVCPEPLTSTIEAKLEAQMAPVPKLLVKLLNNHETGKRMCELITLIDAAKSVQAYKLKNAAVVKLLIKDKIKEYTANIDVNSDEYKAAAKRVDKRRKNHR